MVEIEILQKVSHSFEVIKKYEPIVESYML